MGSEVLATGEKCVALATLLAANEDQPYSKMSKCESGEGVRPQVAARTLLPIFAHHGQIYTPFVPPEPHFLVLYCTPSGTWYPGTWYTLPIIIKTPSPTFDQR